MSSLKNVAVLGASGNVGGPIVQALLSGGFNVTAVTRETSTSTFPSAVQIAKTNFSVSSLKSIFKNQDVVICTSRFDNPDTQIDVIDAAEAAGVKRFVPSEFGGIREKKGIEAFEKTQAAKVKILKYLEERAKANSEFTWSALVTGPFFDWRFFLQVPLGPRATFGFDLKDHEVEIYGSGNEPFISTNIATIAEAVAEILRKPSETANKFLVIYTVKTTQNEMLAAFEEITRDKWKVNKLSTKDLLKRGEEVGGLAGFFDIISANTHEDGAGRGVLSDDKGYDNELLKVKKEDLKDILKRILAAK